MSTTRHVAKENKSAQKDKKSLRRAVTETPRQTRSSGAALKSPIKRSVTKVDLKSKAIKKSPAKKA